MPTEPLPDNLDVFHPSSESLDVFALWQAECIRCGWHTRPRTSKDVTRRLAERHVLTCPENESA